MSVILVIVAHSDDETIGLGGTIAKHVDSGDVVYVMSMTDGVSARGKSSIERDLRIKSAAKAANALGFKWIKQCEFPDNGMDKVPLLDVINEIEKVKHKICPELVYIHHQSDLNVDHSLSARAALTAFRPLPSEEHVEIRTFEVPSSTNWSHELDNIFSPNLFVDISQFWEKKAKALACYKDEIPPHPHTRSIESIKSLASFRGTSVGLNLAEGFMVLRKVERNSDVCSSK